MIAENMKFQIRSKMVKKIAFNYSSDPKYSSQLCHCTHCDHMDSQSHVLACKSYKHLREGKDLNSDKDLVKYFRDVLKLREKAEDGYWTWPSGEEAAPARFCVVRRGVVPTNTVGFC
jgi:hypothetical protein